MFEPFPALCTYVTIKRFPTAAWYVIRQIQLITANETSGGIRFELQDTQTIISNSSDSSTPPTSYIYLKVTISTKCLFLYTKILTVCPPHLPRNVPPILPARSSYPQALPLATSPPLSRDRRIRTSHPSKESVQSAIQHVTSTKSWNYGHVASVDGSTTKAASEDFSFPRYCQCQWETGCNEWEASCALSLRFIYL